MKRTTYTAIVCTTLVAAFSGQAAAQSAPLAASLLESAELAAAVWYKARIIDVQRMRPTTLTLVARQVSAREWGAVGRTEHMTEMSTRLGAFLAQEATSCGDLSPSACKVPEGHHLLAFGPTLRHGDTVTVNLVSWVGSTSVHGRRESPVSTTQVSLTQVNRQWEVVKTRRVIGDIDFERIP
jgi:hypothetical protein